MAQKISADLYNTVSINKHVSNIYFTKDGAHYFNAFMVNEKQKDGSIKPVQYARAKEVITPVPGNTLGTTTVVGVPGTAITETMTRAALLAAKPEAQVVNERK